jgi:hypothetical protein
MQSIIILSNKKIMEAIIMAIQLTDMLPGTMNCAENVVTIEPGENVLLLADTTTDFDIVEAYRVAYTAVKGKVSVLTVPGVGAGGSAHELTDKQLCGLFPEVAVEAIKGCDLFINLTGFADMHGIYGAGHSKYGLNPLDFYEKHNTRLLSVVIANKEGLASDWATYPQPLFKYLNFKAHEHMLSAVNGDFDNAKVHVTDPQGTDLTITGFKMCTKGDLTDEVRPINTFGTEQVGCIPHYPTPNAEGVIVSTSTHPGYIPTMKATIKEGRVVDLEGGGEVSGEWMRDWKKGENQSSEGRVTIFGTPPGDGINWFEELMYGIHPRAFRVGWKYRYEGSETFQAWVGGTRRSGVLHFGIGGGKDEWYRHRDLEVYFPTLTVNDTVLIENGRLKILDMPEVIEEAKKYGDPDLLLNEKWIPEMPPRD